MDVGGIWYYRLSSINDLDLASIGWKVKENGENSNWSENRGENKDIKPSKYGTKHSKMRLLLLNSNEYPGNWERSYRRDLKNEGTDKTLPIVSECIGWRRKWEVLQYMDQSLTGLEYIMHINQWVSKQQIQVLLGAFTSHIWRMQSGLHFGGITIYLMVSFF